MTTTASSIAPDFEVMLSEMESSILRTLLYFDIFRHPLSALELFHCSGLKDSHPESIEVSLNRLVERGLVSAHAGYYFIGEDEGRIRRRKEGEAAAQQSLKKAQQFSALITNFPFVRGITLSGSISKFYMDRDSDIDYFIVTKPGRMWLARTLLVFFKKTFLFNSKKYFCVNYFITEETLALQSRNIYSATELVFVIPTTNYPLYLEMMRQNDWVKEYYPHFPLREKHWMIVEQKKVFKPLAEWLLAGKAGEWLDSFFFRLTLRHWKKKFSHFDESTFDHRLRSRRNESKHHPLGYQHRVLTELDAKIRKFELQHSLILRRP